MTLISLMLLLCFPSLCASLSISQAKHDLRTALADDGSTKNPATRDAILALSELSPTERPAHSPKFLGRWQQISAPEFKGSLGPDADGRQQYTLGRLAFNLFEPRGLVCSIDPTLNPVLKEGDAMSYMLQIPFSFKTELGERLDGVLQNRAECEAVEDDVVEVKFLGGELCPGSSSDAWNEIFTTALETAKIGKRQRVVNGLLKATMGLNRPKMVQSDGSINYSITRPPTGSLKVLYLDDELRITKGNAGTIVVCERV